MRALLFILGVLVLLVVAAMQFGLVSLEQTRPLVVQTPRFEADVARVSLGTENETVAVPDIDVERPADAGAR